MSEYTPEKPHTVVIPSYPNYCIASDGRVFRINPATRGATAGIANRRVTPVIHPKGYQWSVHLMGPDGVRKRVPIRKLLLETFGTETIS